MVQERENVSITPVLLGTLGLILFLLLVTWVVVATKPSRGKQPLQQQQQQEQGQAQGQVPGPKQEPDAPEPQKN
jgi:hypothetical protein